MSMRFNFSVSRSGRMQYSSILDQVDGLIAGLTRVRLRMNQTSSHLCICTSKLERGKENILFCPHLQLHQPIFFPVNFAASTGRHVFRFTLSAQGPAASSRAPSQTRRPFPYPPFSSFFKPRINSAAGRCRGCTGTSRAYYSPLMTEVPVHAGSPRIAGVMELSSRGIRREIFPNPLARSR